MLNNLINEELKMDNEIDVPMNDFLYQEAVLEYISKNNDIDFLLLNENLPGEDIEEFIQQLGKIKIILFANDKENIRYDLEEKVYKIYENGEVSFDEIKEVIKENNYTEELEKEIEKLRKIINEKEQKKNRKINFEKNQKNRKNEIIVISGVQSISKTISIIKLANELNVAKNKITILNLDILNKNIIEEILKNNIVEKIRIISAEKYLLKNNDKNRIFEMYSRIKELKNECDYLIINSSTESFFDINKEIMEKAQKIYFIIEKNIKEIEMSKKLLKIYEENWKIDMTKVQILLCKINIGKNKAKSKIIDIVPYEKTKDKSLKIEIIKNKILRIITGEKWIY